MNRHTGTLAFVPPRYGDNVIGGAEAVFREVAHGFATRGWTVEVLTTCARDHFTWANEYQAGVTRDGEVTLRRFPTVTSAKGLPRKARYEAAVLAGQSLTLQEQQAWINDGFRVPELFHWLVDHAPDYDALLFAPYLFWTTFAGAQVAPERTVLMPCLHDEPYARFEIFQPVVAGCAGLWLQSEPEHALAHRLFSLPNNHEVLGSGIVAPKSYDPDGFRARHGIRGPFILYAGRREGGKGWGNLLASYGMALRRHGVPFSLVTMGVGDVRAPSELSDRVIDVGVLDSRERDNAFAAADAYIQPSSYESFSRTIMEAWLAGTLVIASGASEVVGWHCDRSGAGLTYDDSSEFEQCLLFLAEAPEAAAHIAQRGRPYVLENYAFDRVLDRQEATIRRWMLGEQSTEPAPTPTPSVVAEA